MTAASGPRISTEFEADSFFRCALEHSPDGFLILDPGGAVLFANASAADMLGVRGAPLSGRSWPALWAEPDRPAAQAALDLAATGEPQRFAARGRADGPRRLDVMLSPLREAADLPAALLVTCRDVSDLEEARLAAEARERKTAQEASVLRAVADKTCLTTWELDFRRNLTFIDEAGVRAMRGGPEHRVISSEVTAQMYAPEDLARIQHMLERARLHGEPFRYEAPITRHDGSHGWVRQFGEPFYEDGVCVGVRGAGMDISEEMAARESIERAQQRLNLAAQLAGMEVFELDFDRQVLIWEPTSASILEGPLRYEDLWPEPVGLVDAQDRPRVSDEWIRARETDQPFRSEFRLPRRDGREVWVFSVAEMICDGERPRRLVGAIMDITQRKRSELEILRTMAEMREHEARQKLLLDELNHRVKNTLAAVQSVAMQTLTSAREPEEARDLFIERLLALSTTHDLLVKHSWEGASFQELVETTLRPYGRAYRYEGPDLRLDPNFAVSLGMALHELATNALKHGAWRGRGQVDIATADEDGAVRVTWRESGGPPVTAPKRRGFGSRLLERGVAGELGGEVALEFPRNGVVCTIRAPASARLWTAHVRAKARCDQALSLDR
jgi:PAS domain S-box-containing protein